MQYQYDLLSIHVRPEHAPLRHTPDGFAAGAAAAGFVPVPATAVQRTPFALPHDGALADANCAQQEIDRLQARVRELAAELCTVREVECARLARELHDDVGAHLSATRFALARVEIWLPETAPAACAEALALASRTLDAACESSHQLVADLYPPQLDAGLEAALAEWTTEFTERAQLPASFTGCADGRLTRLTREAASALFRLAQEALNNVAKHARATQVEISLDADRRYLTLAIKDNGRGLSRQVRTAAPRFGLGGMRARCEAFGGTLKLTSQAGAGATVRARLPWAALLGGASSPRPAMPAPTALAS